MRKLQIIYLITILSFISCNTKKTTEINYYSKSFYNTYFFLYPDFKNNESSIKKIFKVADSSSIDLNVLKDQNAITIVGSDSTNIDIDYSKSIVFNFTKKYRLKYKWIKIFDKNNTFSEKIPIHFKLKNSDNQKELSADFETLTVNTLQNFLDYAEKDETKKEKEVYYYILYNKRNQEKIKLIYHEYGDWFEVEIL